MSERTLRKGSLAYYDTFSGLIPCKVLSIKGGENGLASSEHRVTFKLTANRRAYKRGEVLEAWALDVPPRSAIAFIGTSVAMILNFNVVVDSEERQ